MIEKKDIVSLTGWSVTGAFLYSVVPVAITVLLNAVIGNATAQELLMLESFML